MGIRLSFSFFGDQQLDRTLARVSEAAEDASPAWEEMADDFERVERRQFSSEGGASGGWSPLSPQYAAWKAKRFPGQPILVRTGSLRDDLTRRPFGVEAITPKSMAIGSDSKVGGYHQKGGGRLPRRRVVELTEARRREWVKILQRHLVSGGSR